MNAGVILLCAGQQSRLAHLGYPKQMIAVAGEPILLRTVRLVREVADRPICVATSGGPLSDVCREHGLSECLVTERSLWRSLERVMRVQRWDQATALLGDVCWSRRLLRYWMQSCSQRPTLYCARLCASTVTGKPYAEHFAVQCTTADLRRLDTRRFNNLRDAARTNVFGGHRAIEQPWDDFTEDFDTPEDVERIVPLLSELVALEAA